MKRKSKYSLHPKYILGICTFLCIVLIIVSFKYSDEIQPVKTAVGTVLTPMQRGINTVGSFIAGKLDNFASLKELMSENEKLKDELASVSYENKILQQDKYELEDLRTLYELDSKYPSYPKVAARVIDKEPSNWYNKFKIDKGSNDGLAVDMNVLAGNGLVGIITEVGHNYSVVTSIIDDTSSVSGMFLKTSDTCIVSGDLTLMDDGRIRVEDISKTAKVKDGYEVVTSNLSTKFLQGILIGYVSDVTLNSNSLQKTGYLTPAVDFSRLSTVLVITELKEPLY